MQNSSSERYLTIASSFTSFNTDRFDRDFNVNKQTSGFALYYNAGTDTLTTEAANLEGFAGSETGTWTPVFTNGGTEGTVTAIYSKVGDTVTIAVEAQVDVSTSTGSYSITSASLPFQRANSLIEPSGTYRLGGLIATPGICGLFASGILFFDSSGITIKGNTISGDTSLTLTYQTS